MKEQQKKYELTDEFIELCSGKNYTELERWLHLVL